MFEETTSYRRQQRRRAIIAWGSVAVVIALFAIGAAFGESDSGGSDGGGGAQEHPNPFGFSMTAAQYDSLQRGLDETSFLGQLQQTGIPEVHTEDRYVELFPPHDEGLDCSYWEISDEEGQVARICFSSPGGELVQKLERNVDEEELGVTV